MDKRSIVILGKTPVAGKVKTRLAKSIGDEQALIVYKKLLHNTLQVASEVNAHRYLFLDQPDYTFPAAINPNDFVIFPQAEGGLGQRMYEAVNKVADGRQKVILIGTDCPYITPELMEKAFKLLDETDYVIGPARDGGYYLLASKSFPEELFNNIAWSTPLVFRETVLRITGELKNYKLLPLLSDIDDLQSYKSWMEQSDNSMI